MLGSYDCCFFDVDAGGAVEEGDEQEVDAISEGLGRASGTNFLTSLSQRWTPIAEEDAFLAAEHGRTTTPTSPRKNQHRGIAAHLSPELQHVYYSCTYDDFVVDCFDATHECDDEHRHAPLLPSTTPATTTCPLAVTTTISSSQKDDVCNRITTKAEMDRPGEAPTARDTVGAALATARRQRRDAEQQLSRLQHQRGSQMAKLQIQQLHQELRVWRLLRRSVLLPGSSSSSSARRMMIAAAK